MSQLAAAKAIQQISLDDGLLGGTVWGIESDKKGFIWVATSAGLYRYDGYDVRGFAKGHPLSTAYINYLIKHEDGTMWAATMESGVWQINPETLIAELAIPYQEQAPYEHLSPNVLFWANEHTLLLGLSKHILSYDTVSQTTEVVFALPPDAIDGHLIRAIDYHQDHTIIGTSAGMYAMDLSSKNTFKIYHTQSDSYTDKDNVKLFYRDDRYYWVATVRGVYRYPLGFLADHDQNTDFEVNAELIFPDVNVWDVVTHEKQRYLATTEGLLLDTNAAELKPVLKFSESPYYTSSDNMTSLHRDASGYFWFGSLADGMFVWNPASTAFSILSQQQGLPDNVVWSIAQGVDKDVFWAGTDAGLSKISLDTLSVSNYLNENTGDFTDNIIEDMVVHPDGLIYNFTPRGIRVFDPTTEKLSLPEFNDPQYSAVDYYAWGADLDAENNLWWLTEKGVFKYNPTTRELTLVDWLNEVSTLAWDCEIFSGPSQRLFFSCPDDLLLINESLNGIERIENLQQLSGVNEVYSLIADSFVEDNAGRWWLSLGTHGIAVYESGGKQLIEHLVPGQQLPISDYYSLTYDGLSESVWAASGVGLFKMGIRI